MRIGNGFGISVEFREAADFCSFSPFFVLHACFVEGPC